MASKTNPLSNQPIPEHIASVLREADAAITKLPGENHHLLYRLLHMTASKMARVDSFYIGFYYEPSMVIFPYSYDGRAYWDPNKDERRPLGSWILRSRKTYTFRMDNGELMYQGLDYGKRHNTTKDCIVAPIFEKAATGTKATSNNPVIGVIGMQSYQENTYDDNNVLALEWLANDLSIVLEREREDATRRVRLGNKVTSGTPPLFDPDSIVNQMLEKMATIRRMGDALLNTLRNEQRKPDDPILLAVEALHHECERRQTETIELFLASTLNQSNPLSRLSEKEKDVARVLVEGYARSRRGYSRVEIANILSISENTIKTHLKRIYTKLEVSNKAEAIAILKPYLASANP